MRSRLLRTFLTLVSYVSKNEGTHKTPNPSKLSLLHGKPQSQADFTIADGAIDIDVIADAPVIC